MAATRILFVCLGNICRSPMAEGVFRRVAEEEGAAAIGLHARTAAQLYSGAADWNAVGELVAAVRIPVLGNGDIWEAEDALRMMRGTGCDGVIVGRGCLGRPWLFRDLADVFDGREPQDPPTLGGVMDVMREHARLLVEWLGDETAAMRTFRKHSTWYTKGFRGGAPLRDRLMRVTTVEGLHAALTSGDAPGEFGAFLDVHWMILNDPTLSEAPKRIIAEQRCNAEWALTLQMGVLVEQFDQIEDSYLRERKADVVQVGERVLKRLMGRPGTIPPPALEEQTILVAHDLSPADVIQFKHHHFAAFLTDLGGITSHTAIVARGLNVPAVVATHNARQLIRVRLGRDLF